MINLEMSELLGYVDHTLLLQTATWQEIKQLCDEGIEYKVASVCIPPAYVKQARQYVGDQLSICTVIGFPNGYNTTAVKCFETKTAVEDGADEIDMVINIGLVKEKNFTAVLDEIKQVRSACQGKLLKVIVEACLLTAEEKINLCQIVADGGADYIKTSTGFSLGGAVFSDIELFAKCKPKHLKIKAAGGISTKADAERFVQLGCERLGTSKIVKLARAAVSNEIS